MIKIQQKDGYDIAVFEPADKDYIALLQKRNVLAEQRIGLLRESVPAFISAICKEAGLPLIVMDEAELLELISGEVVAALVDQGKPISELNEIGMSMAKKRLNVWRRMNEAEEKSRSGNVIGK